MKGTYQKPILETDMRFLAVLISAIWRTMLGAMTALERLLSWPWRILFGQRQPLPHYEPQVDPRALVEEMRAAQKPEVRCLDRDGITTVMSYLKSLPPARMTADLTGLKAEVRDTLLCMSDDELKALSRGGLRAARLFVTGRDHGIDGVPIVRTTAQQKTEDEVMRWKVQAMMMKATHSKPFS